MKILVVSHMYPSAINPVYGVFVHRQVRKLVELGHDVRVISPVAWAPPIPGLPEKWASYREIPRETEIDGVEVHYPRHVSLPGSATLPIVSYLYRPVILDAVNELAASGFVPDVVNAHTPIPDGFGSLRAVSQYDVPLVTTIHGAGLQVSAERFGRMPLLERTMDGSTNVIVNSTKLERLAEEYFGPSKNRSVVPNGVPMDEIDAERDSTPPDEVATTDSVVLSVGNLVPAKGHRYALEALASLPPKYDYRYVIVGDGPERESLAERARELGIEDATVFAGEVPHRTVFRYLWHSDVFVLPSYQEAFGIAYLEAMACELPAIACRGEGPEDFIDHEETGVLVPPQDASALVDALTHLLSSAELRDEIGRRARTHVQEQYTWEQNARQTEAIFERAITVNR